MRKLLLSFMLICASTFTYAQNYTFSQSTGTYTALQSPFILSQPGWDYMDSYNLAITFPFVFGNTTESLIGISGQGLTGFQFGTRGISALSTDLEDRGISGQPSAIGYQLTGSPGSQILKIEWKNAGFVDGTSNDFTNFQIWLYEGSNKVEMHYGPSNITTPSSVFFPNQGPNVSLVLSTNLSNFTISGFFLQGNPANATMATVNNASSYPQLNGAPATGTVYSFTPASTTGISQLLNRNAFAVYPNPTNGNLHINGLKTNGSATINVYDVLGKVVATKEAVVETEILLNVETLQPGTYFIEVNSAEGRQTTKFVKQ